jgi:hypothetical protein
VTPESHLIHGLRLLVRRPMRRSSCTRPTN